MISLILADAEVEPVPTVFAGDITLPRVCSAEGEQLEQIHILDSYLHRHILEGLEEAERRGRPDILHSFLILAQNSQSCREGRLRTYVHTRGDEAIMVGPGFRPDRNYLAFLKVLSVLRSQGFFGSEEGGLRLMEHMDLKSLLKHLGPDAVVVLSPLGQRAELRKVLEPSQEKHLAVIIGGFPEGDFRSPVYEMADVAVSLGDELLTVPDVTAHVLDAL